MKFFVLYFFVLTASGFTEIQKLITKSIISHFNIKHCILATSTEKKLPTFNDFKLLSAMKIFTDVKSPTELREYMHRYLYFPVSQSTVGTQNKVWNSTRKLVMPKTIVIFQDSTIQSVIKLFNYEVSVL